MRNYTSTLREWSRETNWRLVAGDLFGTMAVVALALLITAYLRVWELPTGWSIESIGFGVQPAGEAMLAILCTLFVSPVFYVLWRGVIHRLGNRRLAIQLLVVWGITGLLIPFFGIGFGFLNELDSLSDFLLETPWTFVVEASKFAGMTLGATFLPTFLSGAYNQVSRGNWTLRTRRLQLSTVLLILVVLSAFAASAILSAPAETDTEQTLNETVYPNASAYQDGEYGPTFSPSSDIESYGEYHSAKTYTCGEFKPASADTQAALPDYEPKYTHAQRGQFEIAPGVLTTENGTVTLDTRFSVRFTSEKLANDSILDVGYYHDEPTSETHSVGTSGYYSGELGDTHPGIEIEMENVESVHVYADVIRNGEVHRYVTTLCPNGGEDGGA